MNLEQIEQRLSKVMVMYADLRMMMEPLEHKLLNHKCHQVSLQTEINSLRAWKAEYEKTQKNLSPLPEEMETP